jgi:hypothetical protein
VITSHRHSRGVVIVIAQEVDARRRADRLMVLPRRANSFPLPTVRLHWMPMVQEWMRPSTAEKSEYSGLGRRLCTHGVGILILGLADGAPTCTEPMYRALDPE